MPKKKVLYVEDEETLAFLTSDNLEQHFDVVHCANGKLGLDTFCKNQFDIVVTDIMMPEMDGFEVCRKLREEGISTPILMLTAKNQENDIVNGLDFGADDYLAKPFSFEVLLARIRALLRRPKEKQAEILRVGDLSLNPATKQVQRADQEINLTAKEYALLEYLMRNAGIVRSKEQIISHVWDFDADVLPNNVELFIMFLRKKIDKPFGQKLIHTVSGFGYKIEAKNER